MATRLAESEPGAQAASRERWSATVTFETPEDWESVMDETTAHLELLLIEVLPDTNLVLNTIVRTHAGGC